MSKRKVKRLNKDFYVTDEYGHSDEVVVRKINELIGIINAQQKTIESMELLLRDAGRNRRR